MLAEVLAVAPAAHWWDSLQNTVFSADVVRPLLTTAAGAGAVAFRKLLRDRHVQANYREQITAQLDEVMAELRTNHGSSLRDAVNEIRTDVRDLANEVGHQGERLDRHLDFADRQVARIDHLIDDEHRGSERRSNESEGQ